MSRAAGHKVTMPTFLAIIRVTTEKSVSLGWGKGYPGASHFASSPSGQVLGKAHSALSLEDWTCQGPWVQAEMIAALA